MEGRDNAACSKDRLSPAHPHPGSVVPYRLNEVVLVRRLQASRRDGACKMWLQGRGRNWVNIEWWGGQAAV
jgi:hypothetical protein